MRKYSCRKPISAKALAVKTRKASWVSPKIAGMESSAKTRSTDPIAIITTIMGVNHRLPSRTTEAGSLVIVGHRDQLAQRAQHGVLLERRIVVALPDLAPTEVDEQRAEKIEHPAEVRDQRCTRGDEQPAHGQREHDADQQYPMLLDG